MNGENRGDAYGWWEEDGMNGENQRRCLWMVGGGRHEWGETEEMPMDGGRRTA